MPFVNVPVFQARQLLTAALLNQLGSALTGFSAQPADLAWPLLAQGNIDFQRLYSIVGLQTFWKIVNAAEYTTLADAIAAAASGGCVIIPPNTTITSAPVTVNASNVLVLGFGMSSVIATTGGAVGSIISTGTGSLADITFANFKLDGAGGGAGLDGITVKRVSRPRILNVWVANMPGEGVYLTNDGTPGNATLDAIVDGLVSSGGSGNHLKFDDVDGLTIGRMLSTGSVAATGAIYGEPANIASLIRDISVSSQVRIESPVGKGISIVGNAAAADDKWSRISVDAPQVVAPTGIGIELGTTSKKLREVHVLGGSVTTPGNDAWAVNAQRGSITGARGRATGGAFDGLDLVDSEDVTVSSSDFRDSGDGAAGFGIDAAGTTRCTVIGNDVRGAGTRINKSGTTLTLESCGNLGDISRTPDQQRWNSPSPAQSGVDAETTIATYTISANSLSKPGDGFKITLKGTVDTTVNNTIRVRLGGGGGVILAVHTIPLHATIRTGVMVAEVRVNAAGVNAANNIGSTYYGINALGTSLTADNTTVTGNMTIDQVLALTVDNIGVPTAGGTLDNWKIEFIGGTFV
jgi:hypothetical protein